MNWLRDKLIKQRGKMPLEPFELALLESIERDSGESKQFYLLLEEIQRALVSKDTWSRDFEWRISTSTTQFIKEMRYKDQLKYSTTVSCDHLVLSCEGPNLAMVVWYMEVFTKL